MKEFSDFILTYQELMEKISLALEKHPNARIENILWDGFISALFVSGLLYIVLRYPKQTWQFLKELPKDAARNSVQNESTSEAKDS